MVDINYQLNPGRKFIKNIRRSADVSAQDKPIFILLRGIVVDVFSKTSQTVTSYRIPPYSLNLKIIGEDLSSMNPIYDSPKWYSPLLPINFIVLPEIGEEVLAIRETNKTNSSGYWLGRVNETATINRYLSKEWAEDTAEPQLKYGFPFEVRNIQNVSKGTLKEISLTLKKLKPGDISIQGRSGTYNIHSFDEKNKRGLLEFGIDSYLLVPDQQTTIPSSSGLIADVVNYAATNTTHVAQSSLSGVSDLIFSSSAIDKNIETSLIINRADKIINVSVSGEPLIYREVLGEKINSNIKDLIVEIKSLADILNTSVNSIMKMLENHQHTFKGADLKTDISIPIPKESTGSITKSIVFALKDQKVAKTEDIPNTLNVEGSINKITTKVNSIIADLENNLSKTQFIN